MRYLSDPLKSKARRAKAYNLEIVRRKKRSLEDNDGGSSEVRAESLEGNNLIELLNMSEDALEALDSVDLTCDAEASERMDEDDVGERFWEDFVLLLDSDQRISVGIVLSFQLEKLFKLGSTRAAELAGMTIGRSDNLHELGSQSFLKQKKF